jgi:hypothetical protein
VEGEVNKLEQINGLFSQFSEENKDKLLETAKSLLEIQRAGAGIAQIGASQNEVEAEGRCPKK